MGGMIDSIQDPLLKRTVQQLDASKMDPAMRKSYDQIAAAGMRLMWSDGKEFQAERDSAMEQIQIEQDIPRVIAHVVIKIISIVQEQSRQKDILQGVGPAATLFMCHSLEYVEVAKKMQITPEILAETQHLVKEGLMDLYKITPEILQQLAEQNAKGAKPAAPSAQPAASSAAQLNQE